MIIVLQRWEIKKIKKKKSKKAGEMDEGSKTEWRKSWVERKRGGWREEKNNQGKESGT